MNQPDNAISFLEEARRQIQRNFGETDTLQIEEIYNLFNIYASKLEFEKSERLKKELKTIVELNYSADHPYFETIDRMEIFQMLMQRRWDEVKDLLPSYFQTLKRCFGNNLDHLRIALSNLKDLFLKCGRIEECAYIDDITPSILNELSNIEVFGLSATRFLYEFQSMSLEGCQSSFEKLSIAFNNIPEDDEKPLFKSILDLLQCMLYIKANQYGEAYNLILTIDPAFLEDSKLKIFYLTVKMVACIFQGDYEGGADACDRRAKMIPEERRIENINLFAEQACIHAMLGNYSKSRTITRETIDIWKREVVDRKALYRLEKDTMLINQVSLTLDTYLTNKYHFSDSIGYILRDIKSQYLLLKANMLHNLPGHQFDWDYYRSIHDYVVELILNDNYPDAQKTMDTWLEEFNDMYCSISNNNWNDNLVKLDAEVILDSALRYRCKCYEKGDPTGSKAYKDLLEFIKKKYPGNENSAEYIDVMFRYYDFMGDRKGLLSYISSQKNTAKWMTPLAYETIAEAYMQDGDYNNAIIWWMEMVSQILNNSFISEADEYSLFSAIKNIAKYLTKDGGDTRPVYQYYANNLWPAFYKFGNSYLKYLCKSINELTYIIKDDSFVDYVNKEIKKRKKLKLTKYQEAILYQTIAGALYRSNCFYCQEKAIEYLQMGRELVKDDLVLNLYFGSNLHKIVYDNGFGYDFFDYNIALGYELLELLSRDKTYYTTVEYSQIVDQQLDMLWAQSRYDEMIKIGDSYRKNFNGNLGNIANNKHILNSEHPLFDEFGWINLNILNTSIYSRHNEIRKKISAAQTILDPGNGENNALLIINDGYKGIELSIGTNFLQTYECDNLISNTSKFAYYYQTGTLAEYAYNTSLYCKGLLLRSKNAVRELIKKSDHKWALRKYDELQYVTKQLSSSTLESQDSLLKLSNELERELLRLSHHFGDFKKSLHTSWRDVQAALREGDLAIEFTSAKQDYHDPVGIGYKYGYYACVLSKQMRRPEIVYIAPHDSINVDIENYRTDKLGKLILGCLDPYLEDVKNIYFSPIGILNQIAIESLPINEESDETLSSKYNFYRLTSTREIIGNNFEITGQDAVVYGGIQYDITIDDMIMEKKRYSIDRSMIPDTASTFNVSSLREAIGNIVPLPATKTEAVGVTEILTSSGDNIHADLLLGKHASETSFKALNGKYKRILHIATHGFYLKDNELDGLRNSETEAHKSMSVEDKSLMKSGLLFAGAANKYMGEDIPTGVDDGILTSYEISAMNLVGLDLCVLSACQTAQGDITSEGVYGLQRGFKKAGAKSILMSLWNVDDEATSFLMNNFYRLWIQENKSKYEALELAKQALRDHKDSGWDDPKYWAAFILLDGLE